MNKDIVESDSALITQGPFELTPVGLIVKGHPELEDYSEMLEALGAMQSGVQFWMGDLCNRAETDFGEKYSQLLSERAYHTLGNYAWICRKVPIEHRKPELSFEHHKVVASLENRQKRVKWLDKAVQNGWSSNRLREQIKGTQQPISCEKCAKWRELLEGSIYEYVEHEQKEYKIGDKGLQVCPGGWIKASMDKDQMEKEVEECEFYEESED